MISRSQIPSSSSKWRHQTGDLVINHSLTNSLPSSVSKVNFLFPKELFHKKIWSWYGPNIFRFVNNGFFYFLKLVHFFVRIIPSLGFKQNIKSSAWKSNFNFCYDFFLCFAKWSILILMTIMKRIMIIIIIMSRRRSRRAHSSPS